MAAPFLIGTSGGTTAASQTISVGTAVPAGDAVMVFMGASTVSSQTVSSVTDSKGNTYARVIAAAVTTGHFLDCWAAFGVTALTTSDTITITWSSGLSGKTQAAIGIPGVPSTSAAAVDQKTTASGASSTPTVTTGTLAQASEVAIGCINSTNAQTISFTVLSNTSTTVDQTTGYTLTASTAAVTMTGSASDTAWGAAVITLKLSAVNAGLLPPPAPPRRRPARGLWGGVPGAGARVAVPPIRQPPPIPRRGPARAVVAPGLVPPTFPVFAPAASVRQSPAVPRRRLSRAVIPPVPPRIVPVITPVPPRQPLTVPRRRPSRALVPPRPLRIIPVITPVPRLLPRISRRLPSRAVIPGKPVVLPVFPVIPSGPVSGGDRIKPWRKHPWPRTPIGIPLIEIDAVFPPAGDKVLPPDPADLAPDADQAPGEGSRDEESRGPGLAGRVRLSAAGAAGQAIAAAARAVVRTDTGGALSDPAVGDAVAYWQQQRTKRKKT